MVLERLTCLDWRGLSEERVAPLYAAEAERWASVLDWESAANWEEIERGRRLGTVSGLVVTNEQDAIIGWSYYLVHHRALQIGGLVAANDAATDLMLDAILNDRVLSSVASIIVFAFDNTPALGPALRRRGLTVDRYWYLGSTVNRPVPPPFPDVRPWRFDDTRSTAELLAAAYGGPDEARPFAPHGTLDEWQEYVSQLTRGTGCGTLLREACLCLSGGPNRLLGVALLTRVASTTGHVAQLAIHPQVQGRRLGGQLLEAARAAAGAAGCRRVTLFVGGRNSPARRLYESARFEAMASFLAAGTFQPRRFTSVAPGGIIMTRR